MRALIHSCRCHLTIPLVLGLGCCAIFLPLAVHAQSAETEQYYFLDRRGSIDLPDGAAVPINGDSLQSGIVITSGIHKYFFRTIEISDSHSAEEFLDLMAEQRMRTATAEVTVNLDRIECGDQAGVDLTHWMWHPTAKPQGLLLSKDRLLIVENLLLLITVEGEGGGIIEVTVDEYLNSIRYMGQMICTN
jgi:hypothetical protein